MDTSYVPLHSRSNYSLLRGASPVESLVKRAASLGLPALGLTDENNLYGALDFYKAAAEAGIKPILGATLRGDWGSVVALIENSEGYSNLCELISLNNLEEDFSPGDSFSRLRKGLFFLTEDTELAGKLLSGVEKERIFLELVRPHRSVKHQMDVLEAARNLGLGLVASSDSFFALPDDYELHGVLAAMRENTVLEDVKEIVPTDSYLCSDDDMRRLFSDCPGVLENTMEIAQACSFDFLNRDPVFPEVPEVSGKDASRQLGELVFSRALWRYDSLTGEVRRRLEYEFETICRMGFADYFLIVSDIVDHARKIGTPAAGRGSGANSLVSYCLGITNADPLEFDLPFERFLNPGRSDYPDLDIDFCWRLRDDVIDYVYRRYGEDHVAMVANYSTLQPRMAFREVAKVFGLSNPVITKLKKHLSKINRNGFGNDFKNLPADGETVGKIIEISQRLEGFPHHLSVHCGGVVITPEPVFRHAPLQRAAKGVVIIQYDKRGAETAGLVKLDLLGNRSLSTIREAVDLAGETTGVRLDPERLPGDDRLTIELLRTGNTLGCNQLESPAMRGLLRMMKVSSLQGVMKALAVIRPGAASLGLKETYVRRERGIESSKFSDRRLDEILADTHGIMVYEDDVLLVAKHIAGLPTGEADRFRRAVTKCRNDHERLSLSRDFLSYCAKAGTNMELAKDLWVQMAKFNYQSFCRGHAASYAILAWAVAYLKAHNAAEFWVAALNNNASIYDKWVYLEAAKRSGINVLLPCVNKSLLEFSFENGAIRTGFLRIALISQRSIESIFREREKRDFESVPDFLARTRIPERETENLICCGAFDFTGLFRPALLWQFYTMKSRLRAETPGSLPGLASVRAGSVPSHIRDYDDRRKFANEWELLGISARRHPLYYFSRFNDSPDRIHSSALLRNAGRKVRLAGVLAARRITNTDRGEPMEFLTFDDEDGLFEATLFPDTYKKFRGVADGIGAYEVEGRAENQYGAVTLTASGLRRI